MFILLIEKRVYVDGERVECTSKIEGFFSEEAMHDRVYWYYDDIHNPRKKMGYVNDKTRFIWIPGELEIGWIFTFVGEVEINTKEMQNVLCNFNN